MKTNLVTILLALFVAVSSADAAQLKVGVARADITPPKSVPLQGQFHLRLSQGVDTPITANVTVLESIDGTKTLDSAIFVSIDLVLVHNELVREIQKKVAEQDTTIDVKKIIVNATHTHTAPTVYHAAPLPKSDAIMDYPEVIDFTATRVADAILSAWKNRKPGKMSYGLDFAVVGFSRRAVYADGHTEMYGNPNRSDFRGYENMEDHDVGTLFFWDENDKLLSIIVNVGCPSQEVEGDLKINADFWHPVREKLYSRFGKDVVVLGWCSAAGDNSPHVQYRRAAIARMNSLRKLNNMEEIARKLDRAVADTYEAVQNVKVSDVPLVHRVEKVSLSMRKVPQKDYEAAKKRCEEIAAVVKANPDKTLAEISFMEMNWQGRAVKLYEEQQKNPELSYQAQIHVIRLADTLICTNPFELFSDYGIHLFVLRFADTILLTVTLPIW